METPLFPGGPGSLASHGHLHGLPAPYLLAAAAAHHHSLNTSPPPPHLPPLPHPALGPAPHHFPPSYHHAASALTRLTSAEQISQSVSKSATVQTALAAASLASSNAKYSIASLTNKDDFRYHRGASGAGSQGQGGPQGHATSASAPSLAAVGKDANTVLDIEVRK